MIFSSLGDVSPMQLVGLAGAGTYIVSYILPTSRVIHSDSPAFFFSNLLAATLVLFSLVDAYNPAAAVIQIFWVAVSLWGLSTRLKFRRANRPVQADRLRPLV